MRTPELGCGFDQPLASSDGNLARFLQMTVILQDLVRLYVISQDSCKILHESSKISVGLWLGSLRILLVISGVCSSRGEEFGVILQ